MPEVIVKYKNAKVLEALKDFAKYFDFVVEKPKLKKQADNEKEKSLPIDFAKKPDVSALAGIWKGRNISLADIRKNAWGSRL